MCPRIRILQFTLITVFLVTSTDAMGQHQGQTIQEVEYRSACDALDKKHTLEFGQKCSVKDESKKIELFERLTEFMFIQDHDKLPGMTSKINELVKKSGQFCNSFKSLQCGPSGVCECGKIEAVGMKMISVLENGVCRLTLGSTCAPQEILESNFDIKCEKKLACLTSEKSVCTEEAYLAEVHRLRRYLANPVGRESLELMRSVKEKLNGGICKCDKKSTQSEF